MSKAELNNNYICSIKRNNKGFSLVELIICVAILSIATIPLFKSFSLAARNNAKAQRLQNATSLAESIMEEVKGKSIETLMIENNGKDAEGNPISRSIDTDETDFWGGTATAKTRANYASAVAGASKSLLTGGTDTSPYYVLYMPEMVATQGEKFNATVSIRTSTYQQGNDTLTSTDDSTDDNVAGANIVKLPRIEEIDTLSQTVLSYRDFSRYDSVAADYFNQRKADFNPADLSTAASIARKTVNITKSDIVGFTDSIRVQCTISYVDDEGNVFTRDLYTGSYAQQLKDGSSTEYVPLNSNIYLFYKKTQPVEEIIVTDTATIGSHKVYLIMQDDVTGHRITDISGTTVSITGAGQSIDFDASKYSELDENGNIIKGELDAEGKIVEDETKKLQFITNLGSNASETGHIYKEEPNVRIFDITVELTKTGDDVTYASITSTKSVNIKK